MAESKRFYFFEGELTEDHFLHFTICTRATKIMYVGRQIWVRVHPSQI